MRTVTGGLIAFIAIYGAALVGVNWWYNARPAEFHFTQAVYQPVRSQVCPGDLLETRIQIVIEEPVVAQIIETWVSEAGYTVVPDTEPEYIIQQPKEVERPWTALVPKLEPGRYRVYHAASLLNGRKSIFYIPFTIPLDCPRP